MRGALQHASTVLVCDDGSTDGSGAEAEAAGAVVLRHARNEGKGVALRTLLAEAHRRGFRHAISMDADGQHLASDLPVLASALIEEPGSLVLGVRNLVAAGAPPSSEFGRRCSNWWIWFETGLRLPDTQSGFRGYPVPEVMRAGSRTPALRIRDRRDSPGGLGRHSDPLAADHGRLPDQPDIPFPAGDRQRPDRGVEHAGCSPAPAAAPAGSVPVPDSAPSRVVVVRDPEMGLAGWIRPTLARPGGAWREFSEPRLSLGLWPRALSWFTCAVAGVGALPAMLATFAYQWLLARNLAPHWATALILLAFLGFGLQEAARAPARVSPRSWSGKSRGGVFGHWFFLTITRASGRALAYWVIYPVTLYFLITAPAARAASREFLRRALGPTDWLSSMIRSYRHLLAFARTMVDRALFRTRGKTAFRYTEEGIHLIQEAAAAGKGAVLLTAHVGNWELAGGLLSGAAGEKLAIVAYEGERERIAQFMKRSGGPQFRIIDVGRDFLASLEMIRALRGGAVLAVHGDRPMGGQVIAVPFLGREARFPVGPFLLAAVSGAPLIATFSLQVGPAAYRFFANEPQRLSFTAGQSREAQLRVWVEQYVAVLESLVRQYPYQWFNFYDFWDAPPPLVPSRTAFATGEAA